VAKSGAHLLALAAKTHSVPFVAVTGLYKLTPTFEKAQVRVSTAYTRRIDVFHSFYVCIGAVG